MAETQLNENALALGTAASWADTTGFADDAELAVIGSNAVHTDLDTTGDTTNGIKYLHFRRGTPTVGPDAGYLKIEFKASFTDDANFVWATDGGVCYLEIVSNACEKIEVSGGGTLHIFASGGGSLVDLNVGGRARCFLKESCAISGELTVAADGYCHVEDKSSSSVPNARVSGRGHLDSERRVTAWTQAQAAVVEIENTSGSNATSANLHGGTYRPIAGGVATVEDLGGTFVDRRSATRKLTLGATAYNVRGSHEPPTTDGLVTVSNVNRDLGVGGPA